MSHTLAITFNDDPDVIYIAPFNHDGANVVELKLQVMNPKTKNIATVYYKRTSLRGRNIYYYSEGSSGGEIRGG